MRKTTKFLTLVLAVLMMVSTFAMSTSAAFTDVDVDNLALADAVELLSTLGVAKGTSDTTFSPDAEVNRQQMAAFIYRLMKAGKSVEGGANNSGFVDLADATFYYMISWAAQQNIIKGTSATTFNPTGNITLQDAYVMLVRALGYEKDEALPYPFGYIDVAEEIGLDEDLPSDVSYTTPLTRGNVAIILANAFYAEMNESTTEWAKIPGSTDQWYEKEVPATVCGKIFNVEKETLKVTATAHYSLDGASYTATSELDDEDQVYGVRYDAKGEEVEAAREYTLEELGLEGSSDDYFLADLVLFVKKGAEVEDDEVIAAQSALVKKTVTAEDVVIATSAKTDKEYYIEADKKKAKVMTGLVEFDGTKTYFGETAPASVLKEVDEANTVKFIDLTGGAWSEDGATFAFTTIDKKVTKYGKDSETGAYDVLTKSFQTVLPVIYYNGLYAADVYDVDGNGYADYIFLKEYNEIVEIKEATKKAHVYNYYDPNPGDDKTEYTFASDEIYVKEATVVGEFEYGDKLLVYANAADYIEIAATLESVDAKITGKVDNGTTKKITLSNGDVIDFKNMDKKAIALGLGDVVTIDKYEVGKVLNSYIYNGVILDAVLAGAGEFDAEADYTFIEKDFNGKDEGDDTIYTALTGVKDGELQETLYVKALVDGKIKTVKLASTFLSNYKIEKEGSTLKVVDNGKENQVAAVKIDTAEKAAMIIEKEIADGNLFKYTESDGAYTFEALNLSTDKAVLTSEEEEGAYLYLTTGAKHTLANFNKNVYTISGDMGFGRISFTDYSKIIIKSVNKNGDDVYTEYTADTLPKFTATAFENVIAIFVNNKASETVEYVGFLYAEIPAGKDFGVKGTDEYKVIVGSESKYDEELDEAVTLVSVFDPITGDITSGVELEDETLKPAVGMVVTLNDDGTVADGDIAAKYEDGYLFAANFDSYEEDAAELIVSTDKDLYFMINDDTKIYIADEGVFTEADADAFLAKGVDNVYEELQGTDTYYLWVVAEDLEEKDANDDIKNVKYVIISTEKEALK